MQCIRRVRVVNKFSLSLSYNIYQLRYPNTAGIEE